MTRAAFLAGLLSLGLSLPAAAADPAIMVGDAYARAARPDAPTGAAFMVLTNHGDRDDRLVAAASDAAERVELHTHREDANGVMRMMEVENGFPIPAGGSHQLMRGGDHVMMMGLTRPFEQGETITLTLTFEVAGEVTVEVPIDNERRPDGHGGHGAAHSN